MSPYTALVSLSGLIDFMSPYTALVSLSGLIDFMSPYTALVSLVSLVSLISCMTALSLTEGEQCFRSRNVNCTTVINIVKMWVHLSVSKCTHLTQTAWESPILKSFFVYEEAFSCQSINKYITKKLFLYKRIWLFTWHGSRLLDGRLDAWLDGRLLYLGLQSSVTGNTHTQYSVTGNTHTHIL